MKVFTSAVVGLLLASSNVSAAGSFDVYASSLRAHLLTTQQLDVTGEFSQYDFTNVSTAFDWTFTTANGTVYQLQGKTPTSKDVFGWKEVGVTPGTTQWYMSYLGDWDGDGETKFDWILVGNGSNAVYKLAGVSQEGTFEYSSKIDIAYTVSGDKSNITFGDSTTPQLSVSHPTSGDIIAKVTQTNGSAYADFYANGNNVYKIKGTTDSTPFEILYANDKVSSYSIGDNKITYTYNSNGTVNFKFYVDNVFQFESTNITLRAGLREQDNKALLGKVGIDLLQAAAVLRNEIINSPIIGLYAGVCDKTDFRYDADRCVELYERCVYFLAHANKNEKPALEEVVQNVSEETPVTEPDSDDVSLKELYAYNTNYFNDLYEHFNQCPYDEPEHKYTNLVLKINEGTLYCHYKNKISTGFTIDPNDEKWGERISVTTKEGVLSHITQTTGESQLGGNFSNGRYSGFSLYENGKSSYSTNVVNPADPNSEYIYNSYNSGVKDYTARYDKDFKLIRFCQYNPDGKGYAWCNPEL